MSLTCQTDALRALEAGCKRLQLPVATAIELFRYLQVKRVHDQFLPSTAQIFNMWPSAALDKLWRFMLLNTDISSEVYKLVGGIVRHAGTDQDDLDDNAKKMRRLYALNIVALEGFRPDVRLWAVSTKLYIPEDFQSQLTLQRVSRRSDLRCICCSGQSLHDQQCALS